MKPGIKVGLGYDVHRLVLGRQLILGGVVIPYRYGLLGHSDADVLLHAIADALLGAAGLGDIGLHFPDTDSRYKDIQSTRLLAEVSELVRHKGFQVGNIDAVIIAEQPKLMPYIPAMRVKIAEILKIEEADVSIKATTNEKMGFIGREEGIAAMVTSLIYL
ncbi:MAG: 2-C-methyl-D-erythritol 2,4-cyclodiphosphate synthase [candidate division Zixibacteria bacterium]|nr:2-C-methyl-D-erythritol 2,4-cyclodiphosphate synthase [candidate division Zixibacteria bacterium]